MIIRKKSVSVLSTLPGNSSFIEKIYKKERTVQDKSRPVDGQIKESDATRTISENYYDYCIYFNIDTQKALDMKITNINYDVTTTSEVGQYRYFSNLPKKNGIGVIAAILGAKADLMKDTKKVSEKSKMSGKIDIGNKFIESYLKNKRGYISKSQSLGESEVIKIVGVGDQKRKDSNSRLLYRHRLTSNTRETDLESFARLYGKSLSSGLDSGIALAPVENTIGRSNSVLKGPFRITDEKRDLIKNSLRASVERVRDPQPRKIGDLTTRRDKVAIVERAVNKTTTCKLSITISDAMFIGKDSFVLRLSLVHPSSGLTLQRLDITIPHAENIKNYYIPEEIPIVRVNKQNRNSTTSESFINIFSQDSEKVRCGNLSVRIIPRGQSLKSSTFITSKIKEEEYKPYKFQSGFNRIGPTNTKNGAFSTNETDMAIVRFCPTTYYNETISNFSSDTVVGNRFDLGFISFFAENSGPDIKISYAYNPQSVHGITIFKRRPGEKYVELGKFPSNIGDSERFNNLGVPNYHKFISGEKNFSGLPGAKYGSVIDSNCRHGRVYEYRILLHFTGGVSRFANNTISILKETPLRYVTVKISEKEIVKSISQTGQSRNQGQQGIDGLNTIGVKFKIDYDIRDNSTDMIVQSLRSLGIDDIFSDEIKDLKSLIKDLVLFGVTRHNIERSCSEFLGYFPAGEFIDSGVYATPPVSGVTYNYDISAYLINPETVVNSFNDAVLDGNQNIQNARQLRDPKYLSKIQKAATDSQAATTERVNADQVIGTTDQKRLEKEYIKRKARKNLSRSALERSTIDPNEAHGQDYDISRFSTGDRSSIRVFQSDTNYRIEPSRMFVTRSSTGIPVLRFLVDPGDEFSSISRIDYFLITCERQGDISICGTAHNDGTGEVTFLDFVNKGHIGDVTYYVTSILIDGTVIDGKRLGVTTLRDISQESVQVRGY